ncbi:hypothetical protein PDIP_49550 [Penicillium digitatum Pd1]|uniref:Uncharacterized protein n=1 Tax=Penicillium digitatum (strain Pd1 / CECT 20795) TaxID=1170230 RepID=K9FXH5_PEND1|nr:hypothetical protein PDIP_49550 [Penicillium digitatum Pd1]EKV13267.1 hypothetical protein PDIP_49550 [Penicillium digitatum Pd1]
MPGRERNRMLGRGESHLSPPPRPYFFHINPLMWYHTLTFDSELAYLVD